MSRRGPLDLYNPYFQLLTADELSNFHVLCEDCQYSIQYIGQQFLYRNTHTVEHHAKPEDFHKAALQRCAICHALWHKLSVSQQARVLSLNCSSDYPKLTSMDMIALPAFEANVAAIRVYFPLTSGNDLEISFDLDGLDHSIHSTDASFVLYPATSLSYFRLLSRRLANIWVHSDGGLSRTASSREFYLVCTIYQPRS
jgi:hypothetical protein